MISERQLLILLRVMFNLRLHYFAENNLKDLLKVRKECMKRQRNEPTEHKGMFFHLRDFDPINVSFILFQLTYPVDTRTHAQNNFINS